MTLTTAAELAARANRIEAASGRLCPEAQARCRRRAFQLRVDAMRELAGVVGYTRRDTHPMPPEQTRLEIEGGMTR